MPDSFDLKKLFKCNLKYHFGADGSSVYRDKKWVASRNGTISLLHLFAELCKTQVEHTIFENVAGTVSVDFKFSKKKGLN